MQEEAYAWKQSCVPKSRLINGLLVSWVLSISEQKVFIIVWGLTEHRGHLVLMIIKHYLLHSIPNDRSDYHIVQSWEGSAEGQEELCGPKMASVMLTRP